MKGLILFLFLALYSGTARAQGTIHFANNSATRVYTDVTGTTTFVPVGSQFSVELMFAPDGTPTDAFDTIAVRVGAPVTFGPVPGIFNGGEKTVSGVTPPGGYGLFQVRGWETASGSSYMDAVLRGSYYVGRSAILRVDTGDPSSTPPREPGTLVGAGLTSFCIGCIPEPSVIALGLCALGAWVATRFRRKDAP